MKEVCGTCKYNKRDFSKPQGEGYCEFCCGNENSEEYGVPTFYDDTCDEWEDNECMFSDYTDMPYQFDNITGSMNL